MKIKILSILLLITMCMCMAACEEQEAIYQDEATDGIVTMDPPSGKTADEFKLDVYNSYKTSVETFKNESEYTTRYSLFDIDGNGMPELIYNVDSGKYRAYSFDGKDMTYSGVFKTKTKLYTQKGLLFATTSGEGYDAYIKISLNEKFEIYDVGYPYITLIKGADASQNKYTYNNEEVSETEYTAIVDGMEELETYPMDDLSYLEILLK